MLFYKLLCYSCYVILNIFMLQCSYVTVLNDATPYHYGRPLAWEREHFNPAIAHKFVCSGWDLPRLTGEQGETWSPLICTAEALIPLLCEGAGAPGCSSSLPTAQRQSLLSAFEVGVDLEGPMSGFLEVWQQPQTGSYLLDLILHLIWVVHAHSPHTGKINYVNNIKQDLNF